MLEYIKQSYVLGSDFMKKIMALLLLCILAVCMLAACGNDKEDNESSDIQETDSVIASSDNTVTTVSDTDAYSEPSSTQSKADNSGSSRRTDVSIVSKPVSDAATSAVSDKNNEKPSETESETTVSSEISSTTSKPKPVELPDDPF